MRRMAPCVVALVLGCRIVTDAQIVVTDPAVTIRNTVTAGLEESLADLQRQQQEQLDRMARRLSQFSSLLPYAVPDVPEWRIHIFFDAPEEPVLFARDYHAALTYGDPGGSAYSGVTVPLLDVASALGEDLHLPALREFAARLATINVADAAAISATNDSGQVRFN